MEPVYPSLATFVTGLNEQQKQKIKDHIQEHHEEFDE